MKKNESEQSFSSLRRTVRTIEHDDDQGDHDDDQDDNDDGQDDHDDQDNHDEDQDNDQDDHDDDKDYDQDGHENHDVDQGEVELSSSLWRRMSQNSHLHL